MLTKEDLKQIGTLLTDNNKVLKAEIVASEGRIIEGVGEMIEQNVLPEIEKVRVRVESIDARLTKVETTMVTKDYLDEKLANTRGDLVAYDRKLE